MRTNRVLGATLLTLGAMASGAVAQPPEPDLVLDPAGLTIKAGRIAKVGVAKTALDAIKWVNTNELLDVVPSESGRWAAVMSQVPGKYRIALYGVKSGKDQPPVLTEPIYVTITVEAAAAPPAAGVAIPTAPPSAPEPLARAIGAAHEADRAAGTAGSLHRLAIVLHEGSLAAADPAVKTWDDLFNRLGYFAGLWGVHGKSPQVHKVIAAAAFKTFPGAANPSGVLSPSDRQGAALFLAEMSGVVEMLSLR
jgi:hypothetical protein